MLVHELQLENRLATSVQKSNRADFALMLAMLSNDALEFSQFRIEQEMLDSAGDEETLLKQQLGVHPAQKLEADEACYQQGGTLSQAFHQSLSANKLMGYMYNQPLSQFNDPKKMDDAVISNCNIHTMRRLQDEYKAAEKVEADPTKILEHIEQVKAAA